MLTTQTRFREYSNRFTSLKKNHLSLLSRSSFYETRPGHGYNTNPLNMNNTTAHRRKNNVIRLVTQKEQGNTVRRTMQVEVPTIIRSYHTPYNQYLHQSRICHPENHRRGDSLQYIYTLRLPYIGIVSRRKLRKIQYKSRLTAFLSQFK